MMTILSLILEEETMAKHNVSKGRKGSTIAGPNLEGHANFRGNGGKPKRGSKSKISGPQLDRHANSKG